MQIGIAEKVQVPVKNIFVKRIEINDEDIDLVNLESIIVKI